MARQRVIKPGFNDDDNMVALTRDARLFYILLWGWLDKQALIEENALMLRNKIFPKEEFPSDLVKGWIEELTTPGPNGRPRLVRLKWRGKNLLYCPTLARHSRIYLDEPQAFKVPEDVLKEARERCNIFIDENGEVVDPPTESEGPPDEPPTDPRGSNEGSTEDPPNSHPSSSSSVPASVSVSAFAVAPAPASAGPTPVDNSGGGVENSEPSLENENLVEGADPEGPERTHESEAEKQRLLKTGLDDASAENIVQLNREIKAKQREFADQRGLRKA